jgi:hypothetical protein
MLPFRYSGTIRLAIMVLVAAIAGSQTTRAGPIYENWNMFSNGLVMDWPLNAEPQPLMQSTPSTTIAETPDSRHWARGAVPEPKAAVYGVTNRLASLESGEPTVGGKMTRSIWAKFTPARNQRIVIHTFGSRVAGTGAILDSVLAVYTGDAVNALIRIAGNDNRVVPGISTKESLVQFDADAGVTYHLQIGSKLSAEGDIALSAFAFSPGGGLSIFLAQYGGNPIFNARDYVCEEFPCSSPKFIVHNSTAQTLRVIASSDLGPGVTPPSPFNLAPGAIAVKELVFTSTFDTTTTRTVTGHFTFTGTIGSTAVTEARRRAVIPIPGTAPIPDVKVSLASPVVRAGFLDEPLAFTVVLANKGTVPAIGCHFRSRLYSYLKTVFQRIHPATGEAIGPLNRPSTIQPGKSHTYRVYIASQFSRNADPEFGAEVTAGCANDTAAFDLSGTFDLSARGGEESANVPAKVKSPKNGILKVPPTGFATFTVRAVNRGPTVVLTARPRYLFPFGEASNRQFSATVCEADPATWECLAPPAESVAYTAARNVTKAFAVQVFGPPVDPGFDPGRRRMFLDFRMSDFVMVGATSVAPKKQWVRPNKEPAAEGRARPVPELQERTGEGAGDRPGPAANIRT